MSDDIIATGLSGVGYDDTGFYALLVFSTDHGDVRIAFPPELLDQLAEGALYLRSSKTDLTGPAPISAAYSVRKASVMSANDGAAVYLSVGFGKLAEMRFVLPSQDAAELAQALQSLQKPEQDGGGA